jgi:hypothetical protein
MIKTIAISILFIVNSLAVSINEPITITADYEGVDDGIYYFSEGEDFNTYAFKYIDDEASKKYNLEDRKLIGESFKIVYTSEKFLDDENEEYEELTIMEITLIK